MLILLSLLSLLSIVGILFFLSYFNKYQRYLKQTHPEEYKQLVLKDTLVATAGEWIRWPIGSASPLLAIFNVKQYYGDDVLRALQNRALISLFFLLVFVASILICIKLSAT